MVVWPFVHLEAGGVGDYGGQLASCSPHPGWGRSLWWSAGLLFTAPRVGQGIMVVGWPLVYRIRVGRGIMVVGWPLGHLKAGGGGGGGRYYGGLLASWSP